MQRLEHIVGEHVPSGDIVEPGVVTFADKRDEHVVLVADAGELVDHPLHRRVADLPDAQRVGQEDGRLHQTPFDQLRHPGNLARAVQDEPAADQPLLENVLFVREDGGDAGAHRALAPPQLTRAADDRRVTDQDAFHVRDGVPLPGAETAQRDA